MLAVFLQFLISANTLTWMGIDYDQVGGNPLVKLHPATYILVFAAFLALFVESPACSGLVRVVRATPGLAAFLFLVPLCAFYSIASVGFSGAAIYIESYFAAGLLAVALEGGTDRQKRAVGKVVLAFALLNVAISVWESLTQTHLIPLQIGDLPNIDLKEGADEFRGAALYAHPLTGAFATVLAIYLLLEMRTGALRTAAAFTVLVIGLLSFGGRMALVTAIAFLTVAAVFALFRGLATRRLNLGMLSALVAGGLVLIPLILALVATTDLGDRILSHLYFDDSADVRNTQWLVLNHLDLRDILFGVSPTRLNVLKYQIGLAAETTDIENFWLLMFLNLGSIGFLVFLAALIMFLLHLGNMVSTPFGWMLLASAIAIDSTSNSLGRKSVDLCFVVACMVAMSGYRSLRPAPAAVPQARRGIGLTGFRYPGPAQPDPAPRRTVFSRLRPSRLSPTPLAGTQS